jgi:peptidyl-prolyl cis-trans isomerase C
VGPANCLEKEEEQMNGRNGIGRSLAGCVGLAILASTVCGQAPPGTATTKPAALVNGEAIAVNDVERVADMLLKEKFKVQPPTDAQRRQVHLEVVGLLINDVLMRQFMQKHAPKSDPAALDRELTEFAEQLQKQSPPKTLADFYKDTHQTEAQFRATLASKLQWEAYVKATVKEADIQNYYKESKEFFDQVAVRASHIVFRVAPSAPEAERKTVHDKLRSLREEIVAGKLDFAEAAKKNSECPSAPNGGDIGYFSRKGMLDENFARTAYALKVGDVSDIIATDYGLHIVKVTERKPGKPSDYEKIKDEVRDFYVQELAQKILDQERKTGKVEINLP